MDGSTPDLGSESLRTVKQRRIVLLLDEDWCKEANEERARTYAIVNIIPRHFEEV